MLDTKVCFRWQPIFPRLSDVNSLFVDNRVIYIAKKNYTGKDSNLYIAYDYKTRIQLAFHKNKDELIEYLKDKKLDVLND